MFAVTLCCLFAVLTSPAAAPVSQEEFRVVADRAEVEGEFAQLREAEEALAQRAKWDKDHKAITVARVDVRSMLARPPGAHGRRTRVTLRGA